jgi:hypothetical protein
MGIFVPVCPVQAAASPAGDFGAEAANWGRFGSIDGHRRGRRRSSSGRAVHMVRRELFASGRAACMFTRTGVKRPHAEPPDGFGARGTE